MYFIFNLTLSIVRVYVSAIKEKRHALVPCEPRGGAALFPGHISPVKEWIQRRLCLLFLAVGIFFVLPCIDTYTKVDLRTVSFDVPPQEVQ